MKLSFGIVLLLLNFSLMAQFGPGAAPNQAQGTGKIYGQIVDSISKKPIAYANVILRDALEHKEKDGLLTEDNGKFSFKQLKNMKYEVAISFLGYETKIIGPLRINKEIDEHNLGIIILKPITKQLDEVTIVSAKDLIENKIDRLVYNAEKDVTTKGTDATEVLRRTPMLTVDMEGNVSLRGSSNVKILINGKPSSIMSANVGDALKMIPADVIEKVEVITQPGAKYDAEGTAGIVNIITKTKKIQGVSGSVNASAGTRSNFMGGNVSIRAGKIGFSSNIGSHFWRGISETVVDRENYLTTINPAIRQNIDAKNNGGGVFLQLGSDYDINEKNNISLSWRFPFHQFSNTNSFTTLSGTDVEHLAFQFERDGKTITQNIGTDLNLDYKKTFDKDSDREFGISSQYSYSNRGSDYETSEFDVNQNLRYKEISPNNGINKELIFATDYLYPVTKKINLEVGAKSIFRNVNSDIYYDTLQLNTNQYLRDNSRNNYFDYKQNVGAVYSQATFPIIENLTGRIGLRMEKTFIEGIEETSINFKNDYNTWIPSGLISYTLKDKSNIKFSYGRRIQRPSMFYLNPYVNYNDPTNISYGNPNLNPELTESFELAFSKSKNSNNVNISLYHKITNDLIDTYRFVDSLGRTNTSYNNEATGYSSGVSINGGIIKLGKIILNSTINVFYQKLESKQLVGLKNDAVNYNVNIFGNINITPVWGITVFGFYNSPKLTTQGKQATWFVYNIGVRRDLWKKKGGVSVGIDNPFTPHMKINSYFKSSEFLYDSRSTFESFGIRAGIDYRFGKMEFGGQNKKKRGSLNDDLKQGEEGGR